MKIGSGAWQPPAEVPLWWCLAGTACAALACAWLGDALFGISWWMSLLAT